MVFVPMTDRQTDKTNHFITHPSCMRMDNNGIALQHKGGGLISIHHTCIQVQLENILLLHVQLLTEQMELGVVKIGQQLCHHELP